MSKNGIPSSHISAPRPQRASPSSSLSPDPFISNWRVRLSSWWKYTSTSSATSYSQLPQYPTDSDRYQVQQSPTLACDNDDSDNGPVMDAPWLSAARWRTFWLATVLCCGGALFGYDSGVIGGVLTFNSFQDSFAFTQAQKTRVSAIAVGIQQAGALAGCFLVWPVTNRWGRRAAMMVCSVVFCIGVVLEVVDTHSLPAFYIGRVVCGLGIGGSATVIPIYMSEMSPKEVRGQLGSCYQLTYTIGILVSYWIDYGVKSMPATARQWQLPIGLQLVPGALMGLGMFSLDESVRWLLGRGDNAGAWRSLVWIRAGEHPAVHAEFADMQRGLEDERHATADFRPRELLERPNLHRLLIAGGLFLAQQSTGSTALAYFGPQFFSMLVGPGDKNLLLTGIFGAVKVIACLLFVVFMSDRFGRRPLLAGGAAFMAACMIAIAAVLKTHPPPADGSVSSAGIATVALIYLDIMAYNFSWGPLPWPCTSEIFPTRIREPGVAFGVGSQWLFNFVWSFSTPYINAGIGWGTFLLFGVLDLLILAFTGLFLKETAGKSLEEINELFDGVDVDSEHGWKADGGLPDHRLSSEHENTPRYKDATETDQFDVKSDSVKNAATHVESTAGRA
ncbi:hypothetical protein NUU61_004098 [Penicillium alfredii]|uniref:Major facilitator superfamily (MFS) profile domain-containing protein n=1 Tax=Penicillium alfredii TaxID=1506179 RepID=A0A9W9FKH7_9EURO|nr:uncharacterized protein NUU61_004098 [Penicillium alfredii]KAJ5101876.1 hypothetical protein NUU61_004098 [Penicillium alfredii]